MMETSGALIVSWDFSGSPDNDILLVGKRVEGKTEVINAYQGEEAREIYKKLTIKRRKTN